MLRKYIKQMLAAETEQDIVNILYSIDGVDMAYQREKISWNDHELLFELADKLIKGTR